MNLVILILYRTGYGGEFLGVGGTWNLNEEKNADAEIVASGVFVGYFIYTGCHLIGFGFGTTKHKRYVVICPTSIYIHFIKSFLGRELSETIMNVVGTIMWLSVGGVALHYWAGYMPEHDFKLIVSERAVSTQTPT